MTTYDYGTSACPTYTPDYTKDPNDVIDVTFNWVGFLDGDTIVTSTFSLPDGLTENSKSNTTLRTTIWLSGGSAGTLCRVTNRVVTTAGRTKDWTKIVQVVEE
jgi:hypothetical protein